MFFRIHEHSKTVEITLCFTSKPSFSHCIISHCSILHRSIGQICVLKNAFKTCIFWMICSHVSKIYKIKTSTNMYFFIYPNCSSIISNCVSEYANIDILLPSRRKIANRTQQNMQISLILIMFFHFHLNIWHRLTLGYSSWNAGITEDQKSSRF